jgi:hypothetical protein
MRAVGQLMRARRRFVSLRLSVGSGRTQLAARSSRSCAWPRSRRRQWWPASYRPGGRARAPSARPRASARPGPRRWTGHLTGWHRPAHSTPTVRRTRRFGGLSPVVALQQRATAARVVDGQLVALAAGATTGVDKVAFDRPNPATLPVISVVPSRAMHMPARAITSQPVAVMPSSCQRHRAAKRTRPGTRSWSSALVARSSPLAARAARAPGSRVGGPLRGVKSRCRPEPAWPAPAAVAPSE